ncbi:hypothetical protein DV735_g129, partial [Chaetothyriales sp. CBS 134920]
MSLSNDGPESVDDFLARVASLSRKNDEEIAERNRKMEEEMMQARRLRRAKREASTVSITGENGPSSGSDNGKTKYGGWDSGGDKADDSGSIIVCWCAVPVPSTGSIIVCCHSPLPSEALTSPPLESRPLPPPPGQKPTTPTFPPTTATTLSRSGTLSWQQRPLSRDGGSVRSRPLSMPRGLFREPAEKAPEKTVDTTEALHESDEPEYKPKAKHSPDPEHQPSRADIAASLGARDPTWFRQTADRGIGSAAYRKSNEDSGIAHSPSSRGTQLPGMVSNPSKIETPRQSPTYSLSPSPAPPSPRTQGYAAISANTTPLPTALASSPEPEFSARTAPASLNRTSSILSSPGRPPSPTKGLGGFVQSAMMKRSDSVSKRWSVQANGLKRGDSVAGSRPTFNPPVVTPSLGQPRVISRDPKPNTDGASSPLTSSRPTSAHAVEVLADAVKEPVAEKAVRPASPEQQARPVTPSSESLLSRSPSKTMDPRRWSPTKASWLESALAKPDSPRPSPVKAEPPAWKVGLERSRSQRRPDASPTRSTNFDSVTTGVELKAGPKPSTLASDLDRPEEQARDIPEGGIESVSRRATESASRHATESTSRPATESTSRPATESASRPTTESHDLPLAVHSPVESSRDNKSPALKPKPQTPPKLDFRSTLRSRQIDNTGSKDSELEFKAVFGKLKPTQTQNYVAPDTFKQNITQGKAALHVTGGPQKTKRVDELKESLLSRKAEMKAGGGSIHKRADIRGVKDSVQDKEPEVPEALARRRTLHKTNASTSSTSTEPRVEQQQKPAAPKPSVLTVQRAGQPTVPTPVQNAYKAAPAPAPALLPLESTERLSLGCEEQKDAPAPFGSKLAPSNAPVRQLREKTGAQPQSDSIPPTGDSSPNPEVSKATGNKLAARLNPALAGLIARGSGPQAANGLQSADVSSPLVLDLGARPHQPEGPDASSGLTHMTKGRAKGPRRRAPKGEPTGAKLPGKPSTETPEPASVDSGPAVVKPRAASAAKVLANTADIGSGKLTVSPRVASSQTPSIPSPKPAAIVLAAAPPVGVESKVGGGREKPRVASKSSELRKVSEKARLATQQAPGHLKENPSPQAGETGKGLAQELAPSNSPRPAATLVRSPEMPMPLRPSKSRLNSPKMPDSVAALPVLRATPKTASGFGVSAEPKSLPAKSGLTVPPEKAERVGEQVGTSSDIQKVLVDAFGAVPRITERREFDAEAFFKGISRTTQRIKTISNKIVKVAGDGKQTAMPPSQEHILYEDSMYLCVHQFESTASRVTEVYLWVGDTVPEAAGEDAQIFCRKVARDSDAKLQVVKQGMESASFLSGLGGILIIRTNTSSDSYMLCGRRHGGHLVFDQVEFSPASLCSGFSYLISTKLGKLYLWIGTGSCADEYGAARLVGADLGLTGEIEEVGEGKEPAAFWRAFSSPTAKELYQRSDTWAMRAGSEHNGFPCKLYRVEQERPKSSGGFWGLRASSPPKSVSRVSLQEIDPFSQRDLSSDGVHLLDTYATLYVLPGKPSPLKSADFVSVLHIAQELAVLTPSVQDRALLPSCRVAFGEPPRDCQMAFRKWSPARRSGVGEQRSACFDIADVMNVLT